MSVLALICLTVGAMLVVEIARWMAPDRLADRDSGGGFEGSWFGSDCDGGDGGGD